MKLALNDETLGMWLGVVGVALFAVTLPMTRLATGTQDAPQLSPWFVTLGRFAIVAPVMLVYAFISNFTYALAGALLREWLSKGKRLLWFNRAMAAVLVLTAWWMLGV